MSNNSAKGMEFGFNNANANKDEQKSINVSSPVEETIVDKVDDTSAEIKVEDTDEEYTDIRKVTIMLVKNYSLYRKANDKVLPKRKDFIGSSVYASRVLSANKE